MNRCRAALAAVFEESQFLIGRIGEAGARDSSVSCQQPSLDRAL